MFECAKQQVTNFVSNRPPEQGAFIDSQRGGEHANPIREDRCQRPLSSVRVDMRVSKYVGVSHRSRHTNNPHNHF